MSKLIFSTFFCAVFLTLAASDIFACTCMHIKTPVEAEYEGKTAVFSGKVISIKKTGAFEKTVSIRVEKSWKGKLPKTITVSTRASSLCGYTFLSGKSFLIYADGKNSNGLSVSLCSRTKLSSDSKEDIKILNNLPAKGNSKTISSPK